MLTGQLLEYYKRQTLQGEDLVQWAENLLSNGVENEDVLCLLSGADIHWSELPGYVERIFEAIGLAQDLKSQFEKVYHDVCLEEYRLGLRSGADLLFRFEDLRKGSGFPEALISRIMEDSPDGTNLSGIYTSESGVSGDELEAMVKECLVKSGIISF